MRASRRATTGSEALTALADAGWDDLLERCGPGDPLRRMAVLAIPDTVPARVPVPRAIVVERAGRTVAAAALCAARVRGLVTVRHLGDPSNWFDPTPPAQDDAAREELVERLVGQRGDLLLLEDLPAAGAMVRDIVRRRPDAELLEGPPTYRVTRGRPGAGRTMVARRREAGRLARRAADRGTPLTIDIEGAWQVIQPQLTELLAMQAAAWIGRDPDDFTGTAHGRAFVRSAIVALGEEGRVRLARVEVGGRLAAFHLALVSDTGAVVYKTAFDRALTGLPGLGWCSLLAMVDALEGEEGVRRIDLGPWGGAYKSHLAPPEATVGVRLALSPAGRAYLAAATLKRGARGRLRAALERGRLRAPIAQVRLEPLGGAAGGEFP